MTLPTFPLHDDFRPVIQTGVMDVDTPETNTRMTDAITDEIHMLMTNAEALYQATDSTSAVEQSDRYADAARHAEDLARALNELANSAARGVDFQTTTHD